MFCNGLFFRSQQLKQSLFPSSRPADSFLEILTIKQTPPRDISHKFTRKELPTGSPAGFINMAAAFPPTQIRFMLRRSISLALKSSESALKAGDKPEQFGFECRMDAPPPFDYVCIEVSELKA